LVEGFKKKNEAFVHYGSHENEVVNRNLLLLFESNCESWYLL